MKTVYIYVIQRFCADINSLCFLGPGLKATAESIDNRADFKVYMQNYAYAHGGQVTRGPRREGPWDEGFVSVSELLVAVSNVTNCILAPSITKLCR